MSNPISRRRFLRDIGVSAAAVPLLYSLDSLFEKANAQSIPKKRFIMMYTPNGQLYANWRLPQSGADLNISDGTLLAGSSLLLNPLQANAKNLLILDRLSNIGARQIYQNATSPMGDGLDHPGGHQKGLGNLLTGQTLVGGADNFGNAGLGRGISIDQTLAKKFVGKTKFPSLEIGVQVNEDLTDRYVDKRVSYNGPGDPRAPVTNPFVLFRNVFGSGAMGGTANNQRSDIDKSVLDNALADFTRLQPKLSSADKLLLQQHADSISAIEKQLTTTFKLDCTNVTAPTSPTGIDITNDTATHTWSMQLANFPTVGSMMIDIMVQAVACGLTNVVTFMWANSENDMTFPWLNIAKGHHGMSHARDPNLVQVDQWYATQFNTMINKFAAIPESGGYGTTMLDNSLLMWTSCLSDGASHHSDNMPITLAGSNGGYFKQGHALRFNNIYTTDAVEDQKQPPAGVPDLSNSDLLVSILNSFEVATDVGKPLSTTFGRADFCHGALPNVKA
jgi:Protein of unknown function (DUF1552)